MQQDAKQISGRKYFVLSFPLILSVSLEYMRDIFTYTVSLIQPIKAKQKTGTLLEKLDHDFGAYTIMLQ